MSLISKTQYQYYEPGEFSDEKERSLDQTLDLIQSFPWDSQREQVTVGLTCPSVTIRDKAGNYLKLALYYHQKYILYYFTADHRLFSHSITNIPDCIPFIQAFFSDAGLDTNTFKAEPTPFQKNSVHFLDKSFEYHPALGYLSILLVYLVIIIVATGYSVFHAFQKGDVPITVVIVMPPVLLLLLTLLRLLQNHWKSCRGKILVLSKGRDDFYYGPADNPEKFSKKNITDILVYGGYGRGSGGRQPSRTDITFKDGRTLSLSGLMLDKLSMRDKFSGCPMRTTLRMKLLIPPQ